MAEAKTKKVAKKAAEKKAAPRVAKAAALAKMVGTSKRVTVRVPVSLQKEYKLKPEAKGKVASVSVEGRLARVKVDLGAKGAFVFRPQDITI